MIFKDKGCTILDTHNQELMTVDMKHRSFPFQWKNVANQALVSLVIDSSLWHKRFGHANFTSLKQLNKLELVENMPDICDNGCICNICQLGKQTRLPFPKNQSRRSTKKLELIHSDVCGPMRTPTLSGSKYFMLFIDDLTRMCWVYFLKIKLEVADVFQKFKNLVENESDCKIKAIRSDNGTEYYCNQFDKFCDDMGIKHQLTVPYSPQQNGVCEKKNRTVMEMARCLMFEKNVPKEFWAEAVNTAVYLLNRLPTKALDKKTPFEAWYGVKPDVTHLKVFGSICFTHIPNVKRDKLSQKAEIGILVGYCGNAKGFRVYNPQTKKIISSRDIKVDEESSWNWEASTMDKIQNPRLVTQENEDTINEDELEHDSDSDSENEVLRTRPFADVYARCNSAVMEPSNFHEAINSKGWMNAMKEELNMIEKNETWVLVDRPKDKNVIGVKSVFKTKLNPDGSINKLKARLVVKGYAQQYGVDYTDTFALVARYETLILLLAIAAQRSWKAINWMLSQLS